MSRPLPGPPHAEATAGTQEYEAADEQRAVSADESPIEAAMRRLNGIEHLPVSEHIVRYEAVHKSLQDALSTIDQS
jgi:hypothetical protein